jgi:hypothetical protein
MREPEEPEFCEHWILNGEEGARWVVEDGWDVGCFEERDWGVEGGRMKHLRKRREGWDMVR